MPGPSICVMCCAAEESSSHLFIHCPFASSLWDYMLERFSIKWVALGTMRVLLDSWGSQKFERGVSCGEGDLGFDSVRHLLEFMGGVQ